MITERQENILYEIVREYIDTAKPISSEFLEKKCSFGFCPATIRNEMKILDETGYLEQPHTSAGRVPTNKGYRFFVDNCKSKNISFELEDIEDKFRFLEILTKSIASLSSNLVFSYLRDKDILWRNGWKEIFSNPEFDEPEFIKTFANTVERFENNIKEVSPKESIEVYIGDENHLLESNNISVIVSGIKFPEEGVIAILGPNRMAYDKNIGLVNSVLKELERF